MRFLILGDIHGNNYALKECLKVAEKQSFDEIIWCGDYVTDFPGSHDVIEIIKQYSKKYKSYIILGNRDKNIVDYSNGKKYNIRQLRNIDYTYKSLTEADIKWLEALPENLEIDIDTAKKIYVSHECTFKNIDKCKIKVFGHTHKQYSFIRKGVKYINPGSVGTPVDGSLGAQFTILDMTESSEVIEHYIILYNTDKLIEELKNSSIYNDDIKWGRIMEKELETGEDYPQKCIKEYKKIIKEHNLKEESLEAWNEAIEKII